MADKKNSMPVLVTGGAGFIGSHLAQHLLKAGRNVVVIDSINDYYDPSLKRDNLKLIEADAEEGSFTFVEEDIRNRNAVFSLFREHRFSTVYHLAAMAGVRPSIQQPSLYFDVNVNGTVNLLDAAVEHGKPAFVFASSSSVYGGSPRIPFTEDDPVNEPISPYAASKKCGELICHSYAVIHGLACTCLRFFTVYGPRQRPEMAIHLFSKKILAGEPLPMFGDGSTSRDYTYIDDIIKGVVASAEHCSGFSIYNLGNNTPVTLMDLIQMLGRILGKEPVIDQQPVPPGDVLRTWADIRRAQNDLSYNPTTDISEGLKKFAEWYTRTGR